MLKILEQPDISGYQELLSQIRSPEHQKLYLTEAQDAGQVTGLIVYAYAPERVVIYAVQDGGDLYLCDGLVRSVLFKAELKGIERAEFALQDAEMLERMRKLHFIQNDENILDDIREVMENCKKCKENNTNT